jgi:hypothetical protein
MAATCSIVEFSFVHRDSPFPYTSQTFTDAPLPNGVLVALSPNSAPQLKPLMFSPCTLHAVTVKLDGRYVSFRLRTHTHHEQNNMPTVEYSISSTSQLSRLEPQDLMTTFPIPSIRGVWHRTPIQRKLVELLPFPTKSVTYDLSNRIISHSLPERFHVNHDLRSIFIDSMRGSCISKEGSGTTFRVSMSTQDSKAAFGDFEALEDWIDHERPRYFRFRYILNP